MALGLDFIRWREEARSPNFWVGLIATIMVSGSWVVNIIEKPFTTIYGCALGLTGILMSLAVRRGWIVSTLNKIPLVNRRAQRIKKRIEFEVEQCRASAG
jgi:hypothetical protein